MNWWGEEDGERGDRLYVRKRAKLSSSIMQSQYAKEILKYLNLKHRKYQYRCYLEME